MHSARTAWWLATIVVGCAGTAPRTSTGGAPMLSLEHRSSMGESFQLVGLRAELDGLPLVSMGDPDGTLEEPSALATPICVLATRVAPGTHSLRLDLTYRGHGYGVFSYLDAYRFHAVDTRSVEVPGDATHVVVTSTGHEGGGAATPIEERPAIAWHVDVVRDGSIAGCTP